MKRRAAIVAPMLGLLAAMVLATSASAARGDAKLNPPTVTPTTGTTATSFQFSVHFIGSASDQAVTVSALVAGGSVPLSLASGALRNGTWTASSTLPAGSWPVTFTSVSTAGTNPSVAGPTVVVTAPTPTPAPTPPPTATPKPVATPRPTPRPTSGPPTATSAPGTSATPAASPTPFGTTVTNPSASPSASAVGTVSQDPNASPSASPSPGSEPFNVPVEGVVAIGLLGAVAVFAALGERRRRRAVETFRAAQAPAEGAPAEGAPAQGSGLEEGWERDVLDDETVATIDYEAPDDPPDRGG